VLEEGERFLGGRSCAAREAGEVVLAGEDVAAHVFDQRLVDADQGCGGDCGAGIVVGSLRFFCDQPCE
jgi:hypothetical protein